MLTIPKGTTSGKTLRLKGKGFHKKDGGRGDQLITLMIDIPADDAALQRFAAEWTDGRNRGPPWASDRSMSDANGLTPEERAHHPGKARQRLDRQIAKVRPGSIPLKY